MDGQEYDEIKQSQLPAVEMLLKMGDDKCRWQYVSTADVLKLRHGDNTRAILTDVLARNLARLNSYQLDGKEMRFSDSDIAEKVEELEHVRLDGLVETSKNVSATIMPKIGGGTIKVLIGGRYEDKSIRYFDFDNPENNEYHVAVEHEYTDREPRRMDIVCFINGIPIIQIENKRSSVGYDKAIAQLLRYQQPSEIPTIYAYLKLLFAMDSENALYGTTGTPSKFYTHWKNDPAISQDAIREVIGRRIDDEVYRQLLLDFKPAISPDKYPQKLDRGIKPQDKTILGMLSPASILDFIKSFVFFDANNEKVARHQQSRAVKKVLDRIGEFEDAPTGRRRKGGLVWHTQGSGKSLTMVMLVKAIIEDERIKNPRIIIVTDRIDLDGQIFDTFRDGNLKREVKRMGSGQSLLNHIKNKDSAVLTTLVHKFQKAAFRSAGFHDPSDNIIVLIDEAHRTEYGEAAIAMQQVIPNACFIGFTGTPLLRKDKSLKKFGIFIDKYTIDDALDDGIVVPLIYEGRYIPLEQNEKQIDRQIDRLAEGFTDKQRQQLTASIERKRISKVINLLEEICADIQKHYAQRFQNTGLKGQIVAPDRYSALVMQKWFERSGVINTAVVISDENGEIPDEEDRKKELAEYLKKQSGNYGDLKRYEDAVVKSFKRDRKGVELLVVVDKLLTGFDAPCNTVLYVAKPIRDHNLLQAIARVNRIFDNEAYPKTAGYIIDYSENAKNISSAMALFGNYDEEDVKGALIDIRGKIDELKSLHDKLLDGFRGVENSDHAYIEHLSSEPILRMFKEDFNKLFTTWDECMNLRDFSEVFGRDKFSRMQKEVKKFAELKKTAELRYGEKVDFKKYNREIARILDQHVTADEIETLTDEVKIFDVEFNAAIDDLGSDKSRAEAIAAQTARIIRERCYTDRVFYQRFSHRIKEILDAMRQSKIKDAEALKQVRTVGKEVEIKKDDSLPRDIAEVRGADILWRNMRSLLSVSGDRYSDIVIELAHEIRANAMVDWHRNHEAKRQMRERLDDYLYDNRDIVDYNVADQIIDEVMKLAEFNHEEFRGHAE
ncbi:HsdR family type I site-specific deoxyribonuclease [Candidatus Saccharibacteria bacterium]|nr:HsdR family type I site-specific deoxyribonuclease [Candidatus Saccharibacteria bacterium]